MPSTVAESDAFAGNVQRPNNGELADAASLLQAIQPITNRTRFLYNRVPSRQRDVTLHGADPTATNECLLAFNTAILEMHSLGGGTVRVPYGAYRINGTINLYTDVNLVGEGAILYQEHLTQHTISPQPGGYSGVPQVISGVCIEGAAVARGGHGIFMPSYANPRALRIEDCAFNELFQNNNGTFISMRGAATRLSIVNCRGTTRTGPGSSLITCNTDVTAASELFIRGGTFRSAASFSHALLTIDGQTVTSVEGTVFDMSTHSAGTAYCLDTSGIPTSRIFRGCTFSHAGPGAAIKADGRLLESDNSFTSVSGNPYEIATPLAIGSQLSLPGINLNYGVAGPYGLPDGRGLIVLAVSHAAGGLGPHIIMPTPLFHGQRLTLTIANTSASDWTSGVTFTGLASGNTGAINIGRARTWKAVVVDADNDNDMYWVLESDPTVEWIAT